MTQAMSDEHWRRVAMYMIEHDMSIEPGARYRR